MSLEVLVQKNYHSSKNKIVKKLDKYAQNIIPQEKIQKVIPGLTKEEKSVIFIKYDIFIIL